MEEVIRTKHSDLIVGRLYHVELDDCCIKGEFIAVFEGYGDLDDVEGDVYYASTIWANGIRLTTDWQVSYTEVPSSVTA